MDDVFGTRVPPSGDGCAECEAEGSWWLELRRCAACGHVGCCELSVNKHAEVHYRETGHRFVQSYEPGESWWWDYVAERDVTGPPLAQPTHHPLTQSVPGPASGVPANWQSVLYEQDGE
jgi:hypothetical protein